MASAKVVDKAVREYLLFLENPEQLVDRQQVSQLEQRVQQANDPLDRLIALAEFERARCPVEDAYREAFIEHAKSWADENDVPASTFEQMGVPGDVLRAAGITNRSKKSRPITSSKGSATTVEQLKTAIQTMSGPFTSKDVTAAAGGGSPMTVRKALTESVESGLIRRLGPVPDWSARGRAPIQYKPGS